MTTLARLFIALTPPPTVREQLVVVRDAVYGRAGGRPVPADNLHLTLAFLGQTPRARIDELVKIINQTGFLPLDLRLEQLGSFAKAQVTWIGPTTRHLELDRLVERLWCGLREAGFSFEQHAFHPHVTLLRKVTCAAETLTQGIEWRATQLSLYESVSTEDGVVYRVLAGVDR